MRVREEAVKLFSSRVRHDPPGAGIPFFVDIYLFFTVIVFAAVAPGNAHVDFSHHGRALREVAVQSEKGDQRSRRYGEETDYDDPFYIFFSIKKVYQMAYKKASLQIEKAPEQRSQGRIIY